MGHPILWFQFRCGPSAQAFDRKSPPGAGLKNFCGKKIVRSRLDQPIVRLLTTRVKGLPM
jgi:hypothetical protein